MTYGTAPKIFWTIFTQTLPAWGFVKGIIRSILRFSTVPGGVALTFPHSSRTAAIALITKTPTSRFPAQ